MKAMAKVNICCSSLTQRSTEAFRVIDSQLAVSRCVNPSFVAFDEFGRRPAGPVTDCSLLRLLTQPPIPR